MFVTKATVTGQQYVHMQQCKSLICWEGALFTEFKELAPWNKFNQVLWKKNVALEWIVDQSGKTILQLLNDTSKQYNPGLISHRKFRTLYLFLHKLSLSNFNIFITTTMTDNLFPCFNSCFQTNEHYNATVRIWQKMGLKSISDNKEYKITTLTYCLVKIF